MEKIIYMIWMLGYFGWKDWKNKRIPLAGLIAFSVIGGILLFYSGEISFARIAAGMLPGGIMLILSLASRGEIGIGDGLIVMLGGSITGVRNMVFMLLLALALCGIFSASLLIVKKAGRKKKIPFIPFLTVACLMFYGGIV